MSAFGLGLGTFGASMLGVAAAVALGASATTSAAAIALAFVPYFWLLALSAQRPASDRQLRWLWIAAVLIGAALLACPPVLSGDVYRYMWDGRVLTSGINPYRYAPGDPALYGLRDAAFAHINHRTISTIYPPLSQLLFAACDLLSHSVVPYKALALIAHLATAHWLRALVSTPERRSRAQLAYLLNPLALSESALNGHIDAVAAFGLVIAAACLIGNKPGRAALGAALATGTKLIGLLLLPWFVRAGGHRWVVAAGLCLAVLAPMLTATPSETTSGAQEYALRWRGNDALYGLLLDFTEQRLRAFASPEERAQEHLRLTRLRPLLEALDGTRLDPWASERRRGKEIPDPTDFELSFLAQVLTRSAVVGVAFAVATALAVSRISLVHGVRLAVLTTLFLSPQIHPWYLLWLLPFEAATGGAAGLWWSVSVLVAYAPMDSWVLAREWRPAPEAKLCEFGIVALVFLGEAWVFYRKRRVHHEGLSTLSDRPR